MVLFHLAGAKGNAGIELGFILTSWRGIKSPKVHAGEVNVNSCVAFRAVALDLVDQDRQGGSRGIFQMFGLLMFFFNPLSLFIGSHPEACNL